MAQNKNAPPPLSHTHTLRSQSVLRRDFCLSFKIISHRTQQTDWRQERDSPCRRFC